MKSVADSVVTAFDSRECKMYARVAYRPVFSGGGKGLFKVKVYGMVHSNYTSPLQAQHIM